MSMLNHGSTNHMSPEDHVAGMISSTFVSTSHNTRYWVIDTGATDHIYCNIVLMHSLKPVITLVFVSLPNGTQVHVKQLGSITLTPKLMTIHNVFNIPSYLSFESLICQ